MKVSLIVTSTLASAGFVAAQGHGEEFAQTMGPVSFMWPPDRPWSEDYETIAPCGSAAGPAVNRTQFPLEGGHIALVAQDDAWAVSVRISFRSNPTSPNDFQTWFTSNITNELEAAHMCYNTPSVPSAIKAGDFGTIQLEYNAIDGSQNVSHFACADVYFVERSEFKNNGFSPLCFNTTEGEATPAGTLAESDLAGNNSQAAPSSSKTATPAGSTASSTTSSKNGAATVALSGVIGAAGIIAALL